MKTCINKKSEIKLYYQIKENNIDEDFLKDIAKKDCVFPDIDYMIYY